MMTDIPSGVPLTPSVPNPEILIRACRSVFFTRLISVSLLLIFLRVESFSPRSLLPLSRLMHSRSCRVLLTSQLNKFEPYRLGISPYKPRVPSSNTTTPRNETAAVNSTELARRSLADDILAVRQAVNASEKEKFQNFLNLIEQETMNTSSSYQQPGNFSKDADLPSFLEVNDTATMDKNESSIVEKPPDKVHVQSYPLWPIFSFQNPTSKDNSKLPNRTASFREPKKRKLEEEIAISMMTLQDLFQAQNLTEMLTVDDLQSFVTSFLNQTTQRSASSSPPRGIIEASTKDTAAEEKKVQGPQMVAFPQPSVVDTKSLKWGTTVAAATLGMVLGVSILPNLWLMGSVFGAFYGYGLAKNPEPPTNNISVAILNLGRRLAKAYLQVYDYANTMWFMYKTGQLSYDYYRKYAELDQKFAIQNKIDMWNARFAEGKLKFDKWEQENEVGRKVLAGLRTVWLVEERSLQKNRQNLFRKRGQSKYRLVQVFYNASFWFGRLLGSLCSTLTGRGGDELKEFLLGLRKWDPTSEDETLGARVGAALGACVVVNLSGAMFSVSPIFLTLLAMTFGLLWPTWHVELTDSLVAFWEDRRARGRGGDSSTSSRGTRTSWATYTRPAKQAVVSRRRSKWSKRPVADKKQFSYYRKPSGEKRYYRVGRPWPFAAAFQKPEPKIERKWWF